MRIFQEANIGWIQCRICLKSCLVIPTVTHTGCVYMAEEGFSPLHWVCSLDLAEILQQSKSTYFWTQSVLLAACCSISTSLLEGMNQASNSVQKNNYCVWLGQVIYWYVEYAPSVQLSVLTKLTVLHTKSHLGFPQGPALILALVLSSCDNTDSNSIDISVCSKESITGESHTGTVDNLDCCCRISVDAG